MDSGDLTSMVIVGSLAFLVGWIVWVLSTNARRRQTNRDVAELHSKLLDRCASNEELIRYLESEPGRKFLESVTNESANPAARILNAIQGGVVLLLLGIAGLIVRQADYNDDMRRTMLVLGSAALAIGAGFLISAAASYGLCKSWGILKFPNGRSTRV